MNTRDPFNLRSNPRASALSLLRASASTQLQSALESSSSVLSTTASALSSAVTDASSAAAAASQQASEAMSFAVPRHVPSFNDPQRQWEDAAWSGSGRSRYTVPSNNVGGGAAGAVADRIGGMFGDSKNRLPMYKDKPFHHQYGSGRRRGWWRKKRVVGIGALLFLTLFYWMGWIGGTISGNKGGKKETGSSWKFWSRPQGTVDWEWRQERVKEAFKLSWKAYEDNAWGYDEFHPVKKSGRQMAGKNGLGWIIVDALDTLIMMNLTTELTHAREWVSDTLDYDIDHDVNTFETTIRMLGGLLSAHYLSTKFPDMAPLPVVEGSDQDDLYLEKAADLADRLLGAYESKTGIPYASINLHTMKGIVSHTDGGSSSTAEATTLQLEMKYLALLTGETTYWEKAEWIMKAIDDIGAKDGLVPIFVNPDRGTFYGNNIRLGSRGDSYYEYLIKQYHQTSNQEPIYREMWDEALQGVRKHLITYSYPSNLTVLGERQSGLEGAITPKMDHLVCFMPGTIALGATGGLTVAEAKKKGWTKQQEDDMELARQLMKTCWGMYKFAPTGLAPEIAYFHIHDPPHMMSTSVLQSPDELDPAEDADWRSDYDIHAADRHNLQRPETVESLFYMWRITGDPKYREWGWEMFQSFVKHTIVEDGFGFSSIDDVMKVPPPIRDNMESFWLAETLKYLYLLFAPDDFLPLDKVVFNTEAHPFPRFELGKLFKTGWKRQPRDKDGNIIHQRKPETKKPELTEPEKAKVQKVISETQIKNDGGKEDKAGQLADKLLQEQLQNDQAAKAGEKKEGQVEPKLDPITGAAKPDVGLKE